MTSQIHVAYRGIDPRLENDNSCPSSVPLDIKSRQDIRASPRARSDRFKFVKTLRLLLDYTQKG